MQERNPFGQPARQLMMTTTTMTVVMSDKHIQHEEGEKEFI